jgi:aminobenzoyl-glutamate utilization protein B
MRFCVLPLLVTLLALPIEAARSTATKGGIERKREIVASVDRHATELIELSDRVWAFAETALREHKSAALLSGFVEKQGFRVERGVAGMPTAFVASYGRGKPIIGVLGEYDALPGLSQKATTSKEPLVAGAAGHGCGHNLFGAASLGAALAIKEAMAAGHLRGTIRFYGTPAEEAVGGKVYMAREGLFDDLDVCLAWHPDEKTRADAKSTQAVVDFAVTFHGKAAHAAYDPWNGKSALDGLELFTHGLNMLREHVKPTARIHYVIQEGGEVPNVVPEEAKVWVWVRDAQRSDMEETMRRVRKIAEGAGLMAEVEANVKLQSGNWEMLVNMTGARLIDENLRWLGPIRFTEEEQTFARAIQRSAGVEEKGLDGSILPVEGQEMEGGSTDVGDVSWITPTLTFVTTTSPTGAPWHAWPVVAAGGMSIGHKGMIYAAKTLASTMVDLYQRPDLIASIRTEFQQRKKGTVFTPYLPPGPPPIPKE